MELKRIVVPLDGSKTAEEALRPAAEMAGGKGSLLLLRVCDLTATAMEDFGQTYVALLDELQQEATRYLKSVRSSLEVECEVRTEVVVGHPVDQLLSFVEQFEADLVLMTSHGKSGFDRWLLGSVTENFARRSTCPVLVLRSGHQFEWPLGRKVLVPLDGSQLAEGVLPLADEFSRRAGGKVMLLRSYSLTERPTYEYAGHDLYPHGADVAGRKAGLEVATEYLQEAAGRCSQPTETRVSTAYAPEAILATAREEQVDMIAMTSHGATGLAKWVFGSVAEKVLRHADRPVLVFKSDWSGEGKYGRS